MLGEKSFNELRCLKRELKAWESMFERKHARKPKKDDVNNASEEIKETYLRYSQLKRSSQDVRKMETPPKDVDGVDDDDVFGKSLNKSKTPMSANKSLRLKISPTKYKPIKLCHGQKKQRPDTLETKLKTKESVDIENLDHNEENDINATENDKMSDNLGFSISYSSKKDVLNKPGIMLGKSAVTKRMKRRSALASDWLEKNQPEVTSSNQPKLPDRSHSQVAIDNEIGGSSGNSTDNDADEVFSINNDFTTSKGLTEKQVSVKNSSSDNNHNNGAFQSTTPEKQESLKSFKENKRSSFNRANQNAEYLEATNNIVSSFENDTDFLTSTEATKSSNRNDNSWANSLYVHNTVAKTSKFTSSDSSTPMSSNTNNTKLLTVTTTAMPSSFDNGSEAAFSAVSNTVTKTSTSNDCYTAISSFVNNADLLSRTELSKSSSVESTSVSLSSSDIDNTDLSSTCSSIHSQPIGCSITTKKGSKTMEFPSKADGELEDFSRMDSHEKVSFSKRRKISHTINEETKGIVKFAENKHEEECPESCTASQKTAAKRSSGLVSENFRALNMKVKRYTRGRGMNYAAYKRRMWKQKQQANEKADSKKQQWKTKKENSNGNRRINSSMSTNCFVCGEDGHWAKECPRKKQGRVQVPAENWTEPVNAPADLEISDEQWLATEEKLRGLVSDRLPRLQSAPCEAPPAIEPLYQPENDRAISAPQEVYDSLNKLGFDSFRCGQEEAIMQILCGLSTLVVLSTGAGKSLCYQLPAYMYSNRSPCITLVISPLVSLMEDQVVGLPFGLHGVSLNTNMSKQQRQKAVDQICSGKAAVVLVSPEALVGGSSAVGCLPHPSKLPPIAFACIDEAHCVSEWSHNFRPSYLRVCKVLRERFGVRCFLGLTATATRSTALSVCEHLGIIHRPEAIVRGATIPDNLNLSVSCDFNRDRAILELLQGSRFRECASIIIYCTRRDTTERLATYLRTCLQKNPMNTSSCITDHDEPDVIEKDVKKRGRKRKSENSKSGNKKSMSWQAECYHAGLSAAQRKKVQKKFMSGELRIVVATVAFGMGLDKADVRAVIHYNMPKSFESYVQEIGRAGRDSLPSHCHVFIDPEGKDVRELRRHAYASTMDRNIIKKLVQQIFPTCDCKTLHANAKEKRDEQLAEMNERTIAETSTKSSNRESLDCGLEDDDDVIDPMVELESQADKCEDSIRVCGGHEVAIPIEKAVQELDMKEEAIETLLCYLELHAKNWVHILKSIRSTCTLKFYGGPAHLHYVAQRVPVVTAAVSYAHKRGELKSTTSSLTFPIVEVVDRMGWDLEPVRRELYGLQWNEGLKLANETGLSAGHSGIIVEFTDLAFHVRAPGDLSGDERDEVCDFLEDRIMAQERSQLAQLHEVWSTFNERAHPNCWQSAEECDKNVDSDLKGAIKAYFESENDATKIELEALSTARKNLRFLPSVIPAEEPVNWDGVSRDIRSFITSHGDVELSGRAIARVFHGIDSPCFPAAVWGRERRFWRRHLDVDFNLLRKRATKELVNFR